MPVVTQSGRETCPSLLTWSWMSTRGGGGAGPTARHCAPPSTELRTRTPPLPAPKSTFQRDVEGPQGPQSPRGWLHT